MAQVAEFNAKNRPKIETAVSLLAQAEERKRLKKTAQMQANASAGFTLGISKDEAKLNKTERAYLAHLRRNPHVWIGVQNITVKLADDCRLTPDFAVLYPNGTLAMIDVKGFQREDAFIKMKVAARQFPMFLFYIVTRSGMMWDERLIER
jgi:hypothetical protein